MGDTVLLQSNCLTQPKELYVIVSKYNIIPFYIYFEKQVALLEVYVYSLSLQNLTLCTLSE